MSARAWKRRRAKRDRRKNWADLHKYFAPIAFVRMLGMKIEKWQEKMLMRKDLRVVRDET